MPQKSLYSLLQEEHPDIYAEMCEHIKSHTIQETANLIAPKLNENPRSFVHKLRLWSSQYSLKSEATPPPVQITKPAGRELTAEEEVFLEKFAKGEVGFEEAQRKMAVMAMRKILQNPEKNLQTQDWLKSEIIKIQREELQVQKEQMQMNWIKLMGSFMPPKVCPKCGENLEPVASIPLQVEDVETINEKPLGITAGIQQPQS